MVPKPPFCAFCTCVLSHPLCYSLMGWFTEGGVNKKNDFYPHFVDKGFTPSATKTMGDSNFPNRPALGQLNLIE